ncbi:MAG: ferrous iron transport protein B [Eubacteriales bacterium]|nr:ferrous iron transport protein B [Eubacteriales bacterium]
MKKITVALIGNQNCGKTTLFNQLTGSNQHVGNFPGVTVEKKVGIIKKHPDVSVVDLPGIYSLAPYTSEEVVTRDFLLKEKPDAIINILDATNIERNLYLTLQLMDLNMPMVLAFNMMDEVESNGNYIDVKKIEEELKVPVVPISASKKFGISELVQRTIKTAQNGTRPGVQDFCLGQVHKAIHAIGNLIEDSAVAADIPIRFAATKLVEGDEPMMKTLSLTENQIDIVGHITDDMEKALGTDREAALADMRYEFIERLCRRTVVKHSVESREHIRSVKIDNVLTNRIWAIPIFLGIMLTVFWLTFGVIGAFLSDILEKGIEIFTQLSDQTLSYWGISEWMHSLIIDGVYAGVGGVLSFLPIIVVLFFFLSILEDSGYMARVAFVMDKILRKIGLSGRSFVPMLIGFGCSVPAIMATRTLSGEHDRKMTILLIPFMSCSAKLPIYALFTAVFFQKNQALVMISLYVIGIIIAIICGWFLKSTVYNGEPVPFIMELPSYRLPSLKSIYLLMWDKAKDFLQKAFTIIFVGTIIIWILQSLDTQFNLVENGADSILALVGRTVSPVFAPLGFNDWRAATALITGLTAKEAVVSTFAVLGVQASSLSELFTPLQAFSFLTFTLLYMPCVAAMAAIRRELGSGWQATLAMVWQTGIAWIVAMVVYTLGRLMGFC